MLNKKSFNYSDPLPYTFILLGISCLAIHTVVLTFFFLLVAFLLTTNNDRSLLVSLSFATLWSLLSYAIFYLASPLIWGINTSRNLSEFAPEMRRWMLKNIENPSYGDGSEMTIVYVTTLLLIAISVGIGNISSKPLNHVFQTVPTLAKTALLSIPAAYFLGVGINPPFSNFQTLDSLNLAFGLGELGVQAYPLFANLSFSSVLSVLLASVILLIFVVSNYKSRKLTLILATIFLVPVCFISTALISTEDYTYVFAPALKLINGFPLSEIYFQYDLVLSLLATPFLLSNVDPNFFQLVLQFSLWLLFLISFIFATRFFVVSDLAVPFVLTIVFIRIYASHYDPTLAVQVTPFRLDWWIVPLVLCYRYGLSHWSIGASLGILLIIHSNFGIIYSLAFTQAVLFLQTVEVLSEFQKGKFKLLRIKVHLLILLEKYSLSIGLVIAGLIANSLIFNHFGASEAAKFYREFGIGFTKIGAHSFFWLILPLLLFTTTVLIKVKPLISKRYLDSAFFAILLCVGNLIYFLGRSVDSNLVWISTSIVLILFICIDLILVVSRKTPRSRPYRCLSALPFLVFLMAVFFYSERASNRIEHQIISVATGDIFNFPSTDYEISTIADHVGNNEKVFVMSKSDFYIYYYGRYSPVAYYTPYNSWIFNSELINYMQGLLEIGYVLVCDECDDGTLSEIANNSQTTKKGRYTFITRTSSP